MRAESHYVDLLEARASELRERAASARILDDPEDTEERHDPLPARKAPLSAVAAPVVRSTV